VSADNNLGDAAGGLALNGGTLRTTASFSTSRSTTLGAGGGTFETATGTTLTHTGAIGGTGGLTKTGDGTLTLANANTYIGGTTVIGGLINFATGNNLGTGTITLNGGGLQWAGGNTLDISGRLAALGAAGGTFDTNGNNVTFASTIGGTGGLTKTGPGTLTFDAANTYTGATTISSGTLALASNGSIAQSSGVNLAAPGAIFDITATDSVIQDLTGVAGTTVSVGNHTLRLGTSNSTTFAGTITGTGSLLKQGSGTLTLTGNSSLGGAVVTAGQLTVMGNLTGGVVVASGATLAGTGTITGGVVTVGNIQPTFGTMNIDGDYVQGGGTYTVGVTPAGTSDRVSITGAAVIGGGTVSVMASPGAYNRTTQYTILTADGGRVGQYDGVTSNFAFLAPSLSYDANNVFLTMLFTGFASGAQTPNQFAVGTALDRANTTATGDFGTVLNALAGLGTTQGPAALDAISGQPYADFGTANAAMGYAFANAVGQQLAGQGASSPRVALAEACDVACDATRWGAWLSAVGGLGSVPGQGNNSGGFTYNFGGTAVGLDYRLDPRVLVGVSLGFTAGSQWVNGFNGRGSIDAFSGSLYGAFSEGAVYVNAVTGYSRASNRLTRVITIPGLLQRTAYGQTTADQFLGQLEAGYRLAVGPGSITPFARLQGSTTNQAGFTEWGAESLNLTVAQQTTNSLRTTLGAELQADVGPVDLRLRLGWLHEYADTARPMTASFAGSPGNAFTVFGATPQRDSAAIGFSGRAKVGAATEFYARYDGEVGGGFDNHAFNVGLRMMW
jgi:autotransporter-associated beta strand protein